MNENLPIAIGFLTLCFGLFVYFIGFTDWYDKRLLDCTPVSKCRSVALGPAVISGRVGGPGAITSLIAHLPCFISRVVVEECKQSGRNNQWNTVHKREWRMPFYLIDDTGEVRVLPEKAVLWLQEDVKYSTETGIVEYSPAASERATQQNETLDDMFREYCITRGINTRVPLRFTETNLSPGDPVFVYGSASAGRDSGDKDATVIQKTFWQTPYIMEGDRSDMLRKLKTRGILRVLVGSFSVIIGTGILAHATTTTEKTAVWTDYFMSSSSAVGEFASLFFLAVLGVGLYVALIYNGLVSLRNEVDRAFSNVDVLLQQRFDLIPNLVSVCRAYMEHESSVMQAVSASRGQWSAARGRIDKFNAAAVAVPALRQLLASAEAYPRLRANENFLQLQQSLSTLEEQIADRRELYNSAVSFFNSRIGMVPDRFVAGTFGFEEQPFFRVEKSAEAAPAINAGSGL
ncbi:MAG TPA: LemA family protein [Terriglobales bacterium]